MRSFPLAVLLLPLATSLAAQVPQGWYVFGTFGSTTSTLQKGLWMSHPRAPDQVTAVTGLQGDLVLTGSASVLYRASDGAILVGERSPVNASVDVHVIRLQGSTAVYDASFSVGTGGPCCGEIPQMDLLPDGRIVVAATDLSDGPLKNYQTTSYGWQGLGIVDTASGRVTPIAISNGASILDVFNALALAPDAKSVYVGTYVSSTRGDIYQVPIGGGPAALVATVPAGISNLAFANDGFLMVTDAYTTQGLFRVNLSNGAYSGIPHSSNQLNGIANESVTGNFAVVTGTSGLPSRSVFWMEPNGAQTLLSTPSGIASPSGIAIALNPGRFGAGTRASNDYDWKLAPNPGGLPELGNATFSLTAGVNGSATVQFGLAIVATSRLAAPFPILGVNLWIDPMGIVFSTVLPPAPSNTIPLPIPNNPTLTGLRLYLQTLHQEVGGAVGATPGVQLTVL
jgi:hypothetical protein